MSNIKGTQTEKNIQAAFSGESMARNKYTFYEEQARKEGNEELAKLFERMAKNETTHAKLWYKLLNNGISSSMTNIQEAAQGENQEWSSMYPSFAKTAREEGLEEVAALFEQVAAIEKNHEHTFLKALEALLMGKAENADTFKEEETVKSKKPVYRCIFCGAVFDKRPDVCPVCQAIGAFEQTMED